MAAQAEPEVVLYDLACTKNICFSPAVWRTRLMLNYKRIAYKTVFVEFPDIESTLKPLGLVPAEPGAKYTVPAIHHVPSGTYMMDSAPISEFLEATYPDPPLPLASELGRSVESTIRTALRPVYATLLMPRELLILAPPAADYFRRTREAVLGRRLEDLLEGDAQEKAWAALEGDMPAINQLMRTHAADGPFVLGAQLSYTDFAIVGFLQCVKVVDEGVFQRLIKGCPGLSGVYTACLPYMEKQD